MPSTVQSKEHRTAAKAAEQLEWAGCDVTTGLGGTGVVDVLRNGAGPTVMLRADMDGLPVREATGLPYASNVTVRGPNGHDVAVMHACGHDMHATWLAGATKLLARATAAWHGTLISLFQPAEELGTGAQARIDDKLFEQFPKPDVILGQHVMPPAAGQINSVGMLTSISLRRTQRSSRNCWVTRPIGGLASARHNAGPKRG